MNLNRLLVLAGSVVAAGAASLHAQSVDQRDPDGASRIGSAAPSLDEDTRDTTRPTRSEPEAQRRFNLSLRPRVQHDFESDLRDSDGSSSVTRVGGTLGLAFPVSPRLRVLINADGEYSSYNWSGAGDFFSPPLPDGDDDLTDNAWMIRLTPGLAYAIDESWTLTGGGIVELAAEDGADLGEAYTFGGFIGARYRWSDRFTTTFGVMAKTRLEDNALVVPLLGLQWAITDKLSLQNEGIGLKLQYQMSEQWRLGAFGRWELRDYRLNDDGPVPDGVLSDQRVPIGVSVEWRPSPGVQIELAGGAIVYQEYTFHDQDGDELESSRSDITPFIGVTATIAF